MLARTTRGSSDSDDLALASVLSRHDEIEVGLRM
jgi:hypothetical protein